MFDRQWRRLIVVACCVAGCSKSIGFEEEPTANLRGHRSSTFESKHVSQATQRKTISPEGKTRQTSENAIQAADEQNRINQKGNTDSQLGEVQKRSAINEKLVRKIRLEIGGDQTLVFCRVSPRTYEIEYPDFYVLETEVTNAQFKTYLDATKQTKDDTDVLKTLEKRRKRNTLSTGDVNYSIKDETTIWRDGDYREGLDEHPVALITLYDATRFCRWLTKTKADMGLFRLPTWNEWMIAAYGKSRSYPWGNEWRTNRLHSSYGYEYDHGFFRDDEKPPAAPKRTEPVKARPQGKSPEGVFGLLGNVAEYILAEDPVNGAYVNLGSRWMGGGFTDGLAFPGFYENHRMQPRNDYWGYSHHAIARTCDLGFRVVLDTNKNLKLISRPRLFKQNNKAWMVKPDDVESTSR